MLSVSRTPSLSADCRAFPRTAVGCGGLGTRRPGSGVAFSESPQPAPHTRSLFRGCQVGAGRSALAEEEVGTVSPLVWGQGGWRLRKVCGPGASPCQVARAALVSPGLGGRWRKAWARRGLGSALPAPGRASRTAASGLRWSRMRAGAERP